VDLNVTVPGDAHVAIDGDVIVDVDVAVDEYVHDDVHDTARSRRAGADATSPQAPSRRLQGTRASPDPASVRPLVVRGRTEAGLRR
jgi:hypothetical protein